MGLRRLMAKNSRKLKGFVQYFNITYVEHEKHWYAWYYVTEDFKGLQQTLEGAEE